MTLHIIRAAALFAALALVATTSAQPPLPPPRPVQDKPDAKLDDLGELEAGIQVAEKGPIHEAFAQPGADTRGKGMTAPKAPPAPIPEVPPETKPDGENVKWVGGYWQWDAEKKDFLWISGFWRNVPAGRDWQAGKWLEKNGSWMYTPGFWRPSTMNNWRTDLPEPPAPVESRPGTPPNDPNAIWVPGGWEFRNERYVWRAGYWAHPNDNQVWQPGQYLTTGSGYSYCPGYWDYPLEERGLLYAPVYFNEPLWQTPGWGYRPRYALGLGYGGYGNGGYGYGGYGTGGLFGSLFIGPGFNNYCYGNYYNPWYNSGWLGSGGLLWGTAFGLGFGFGSSFCGWGGYYPWWGTCRGYSNQLWNHYCHLNKGNPNWAANVQNTGVARAIGVAPRPTAIAANNAGTRPLAVSPGVGGAAQTAVRSAAKTAATQPLIQPAGQVAKALQTAKANPAVAGGAPRIEGGKTGGGGVVARPAGKAGETALPGTGRAVQASPVHSGASKLPVGGGNPVGSAGEPTIRRGNVGGGVERPSSPIQPSGGTAIKPANAGTVQPGARSGTLPVNPSSGPGNAIQARPTAPSLPSVRPSAPSLPSVRPSAPSAPAFRPSAPSMPSIRPSGGNFGGGGRSIQVAPSGGGRSIGGGGGARPGGGGGARPGGKR